MNPLDYYEISDDVHIYDKMHRMALLIEKLMQAVEHLRKENKELEKSLDVLENSVRE